MHFSSIKFVIRRKDFSDAAINEFFIELFIVTCYPDLNHFIYILFIGEGDESLIL